MTSEINPLAILFVGRADIYEFEETFNKTTYQTEGNTTLVAHDEPCRVSFGHDYGMVGANRMISGASTMEQNIVLFVRPDLVVKSGSIVEVTQHGRVTKFKSSGAPAVYLYHQEIALELYEVNA